MADMEREFNWDDTIEKDSTDFVLLQEGDYDFEVESYERARHGGSEKLPPCNKAVLKLRIESEAGTAYLTHNLFLHSKTEGILSSFFSSIGLKKKGEPLRMNWNLVPGSKGRCKVKVRNWKGNDGEERRRMRLLDSIRKKIPLIQVVDTEQVISNGVKTISAGSKRCHFDQWEKVDKTLLVLPTGCGKTIVFAKVTEECVRRGCRVLILAHRGELLQQAADKIAKATKLGCATEKADETCLGSLVPYYSRICSDDDERKAPGPFSGRLF